MIELLQLERNPGCGKGRAIEISARAPHAYDHGARADRPAEVEHQLAFRAPRSELRAPHERRRDAVGVAQERERRVTQIHQPLPVARIDIAQFACIGAEPPGGGICAPQRLVVQRRPLLAVVDLFIEDALLLRALQHRYRQPVRGAVDTHGRAVLVIATLELHMVEEDEDIGTGHAMQVAEPRQVVRLVNRDAHSLSPEQMLETARRKSRPRRLARRGRRWAQTLSQRRGGGAMALDGPRA